MTTTILPAVPTLTPNDALWAFDGFSAANWAAIEEHVAPSILAHAQAQPTRAATALLIVAEAARLGLLAFDHNHAEA